MGGTWDGTVGDLCFIFGFDDSLHGGFALRDKLRYFAYAFSLLVEFDDGFFIFLLLLHECVLLFVYRGYHRKIRVDFR